MEFSVEYSIIKIFNSYSPSPVHHTVKQLTMTLNALLASAESRGRPIIGADIKHFTDYRYRPFSKQICR